MTLEDVKANKNFNKEFNSIKINNGQPFFCKKDYQKVKEGVPQYTDSKEYGKSGSCIAVISRNTLAIFTNKKLEYPEPINWSEKIKNMKIYEKCHIIAYSLSAKKSDANNIFIGTEYLNITTMKKIEKDIYNDIKQNSRTYLYRVTPIYKFEEDVVPIGILIEAETVDKNKKKTVCEFCYNIQKGIKINYYDGSNKPIEEVYGTKEVLDKKKRKTDKSNNKYKDYSINIKTKMFHLEKDNKKCCYLRNVEPKYIQETTAYEKDILKEGFTLCKRCTSYNSKIKK